MSVPSALIWVSSQWLPASSVTLVTNKGDNEIIPGVVYRSPGIYLRAEENPGKPRLGDRLTNAVRPVIASNGVAYLQNRSVG